MLYFGALKAEPIALVLLAASLCGCSSPSSAKPTPAGTQPTFVGTWAAEFSLASSLGGSQWLFFAANVVSEQPVGGSCPTAGAQPLGQGLTACFIADTSTGQGSFPPLSCNCAPNAIVIGIGESNTVLVYVKQETNVTNEYLGSGTSELINGLYQVNGTWQCDVSCVGLDGPFTLTQSSSE
jgi:hypothetical protein